MYDAVRKARARPSAGGLIEYTISCSKIQRRVISRNLYSLACSRLGVDQKERRLTVRTLAYIIAVHDQASQSVEENT